MVNLLSLLFGCPHRNLSRVFTVRRVKRYARRDFPQVLGGKETYRLCLDCGRKFDFDWERMGAKEDDAHSLREEIVWTKRSQ